MTIPRKLFALFAAIAAAALLAACAGGPGTSPRTPPTFVAAWTQDGPDGQVFTAESNDGIVWRNLTAQNLQGNQSESNSGPALAHDRKLSWMLMWPNPRGLDYKTGVGGLALSGRGGVVWEAQPQQGRLPLTALGNRPEGSPALAYAADRWVAAFRVANSGGRIKVVRSLPNSASAWESAQDVAVLTPSGARSLNSANDPALAYGQGMLVLVHRDTGGYSASASVDGVSWTDRGIIAQIPDAEISDPAITFSGTNFFVALRKRLPVPPGWGAGANPSAVEIYKSADALTWTRVAASAGYFSPSDRQFGPAFSWGDFGANTCKAILVDRAVQLFPASIGPASGVQFWTGTPPPPHTCADPGLLQFAPSEAAGSELSNRRMAFRAALSFGASVLP